MNCHHLTVASRILILNHLVVAFGDDDTVFNDDAAERSAVSAVNAFAGFVDGHPHEFVHLFSSQSINILA